jgi:hypothetical protein
MEPNTLFIILGWLFVSSIILIMEAKDIIDWVMTLTLAIIIIFLGINNI